VSSGVAVLVLLCIAVLAANLPFLTERILFLRQPRGGRKALGWRLVELVLLYLVVGILANLLEAQAYGSPYRQNWEFYAITFCLFVVFGYLGFVYCYLWRRR
jgi:Na+(H+)/acetate symporter ActP